MYRVDGNSGTSIEEVGNLLKPVSLDVKITKVTKKYPRNTVMLVSVCKIAPSAHSISYIKGSVGLSTRADVVNQSALGGGRMWPSSGAADGAGLTVDVSDWSSVGSDRLARPTAWCAECRRRQYGASFRRAWTS